MAEPHNGDDGKSSGQDGIRRPKSNPLFQALGSIDELNCSLGVALSKRCVTFAYEESIPYKLIEVQNVLYEIGTIMGTPVRLRTLSEMTDDMTEEIEEMNSLMPPLQSFIIPRGCNVSTSLHMSRAICRRAERDVVAFIESGGECDPDVVKFLNRLSNWLFVAARMIKHALDGKDVTVIMSEEEPHL